MKVMIRQGFTLVEVLVILAILAALAAVLVPTVSNQVRKADVGRVTGDLTNLRSGIEAFLVNVNRYPGDAEDLATTITTADADINGVTYSPGLVGKWEGPYIDRVFAAVDSMETGFGGLIRSDFGILDYGNGIDYLTVVITGIAQPEFDRVDADMDDGDGIAAGRLRWEGVANTGTDTTTFLAIPIN